MPKRFDYALVLIERLKKDRGAFLDIRTIAHDYDLSRTYLEKVAQGLKNIGWLEGRRGSGGGYRLAKDPRKASVELLINHFERWPKFCPVARFERLSRKQL